MCYRYIELNPVRADMVRDPGEYRWSSYRWHGLGVSNELITDHPLFKGLAADESERRAGIARCSGLIWMKMLWMRFERHQIAVCPLAATASGSR